MSQWPNDKGSLEARNFARVSNGVCVLPQSEVKGGSRVSLWSSVPVVLSAPDRKLVRISMRPEKWQAGTMTQWVRRGTCFVIMST